MSAKRLHQRACIGELLLPRKQENVLSIIFTVENNELITASTPIIMTEDGNEAAVAVIGAQLRYSKFYDLFMNTTKLCSSSSNEVLCHDLCRNDVSKRHSPFCYAFTRLYMLR